MYKKRGNVFWLSRVLPEDAAARRLSSRASILAKVRGEEQNLAFFLLWVAPWLGEDLGIRKGASPKMALFLEGILEVLGPHACRGGRGPQPSKRRPAVRPLLSPWRMARPLHPEYQRMKEEGRTAEGSKRTCLEDADSLMRSNLGLRVRRMKVSASPPQW